MRIITKRTITQLFASIIIIVMMAACTPKDFAYFQDKKPGTSEIVPGYKSTPFKLRPGDRISIYVKSRNEELSKQFNMYYGSNGNMSMGMGNGNNYGGYLINEEGYIDFPVLGNMKVAGMDREELKDSLTNVLRESKLVDDAIVTVEYTGLYITLLGANGGSRVPINKDRLTFYEFMAQIGDLNINALRKNILVIREEDGVRSQFEIDVTRMDSVYNSPVYYLHQNDIVYIEPNNKTKRNSTNIGNLFHTWGFWSGILGLGGVSLWSLIRSF